MRKLSFYHLLDSNQINDNDIKIIFDLADKYLNSNLREVVNSGIYRSNILATVFFEPSTRTRLSFESAMYRLGGQVITQESGDVSSAKKGETLSDSGRIVSNYADIIVIRHPEIGSVLEFSKYATVPVVNAGDGHNQHPTQALVDSYTIYSEKKKINNLKIGILGDLKYGRAIHSTMDLMSRYSDNCFTLISHPSLSIGKEKKEALERYGCQVNETSDIWSAIKDLDVLYVSRVQKERFDDIREFEKVKNLYCVNKEILSIAREDMIVLHPLPRISEIATEVDFMLQAKYFTQAKYALYVRMALLSLMIDGI